MPTCRECLHARNDACTFLASDPVPLSRSVGICANFVSYRDGKRKTFFDIAKGLRVESANQVQETLPLGEPSILSIPEPVPADDEPPKKGQTGLNQWF